LLGAVKIGDKIRGWLPDVLALATYVVSAVVMFIHLWRDPGGLMLADNKQDEIFFEWVLTHAGRVVTHGDSPLFTEELNAPLGVNLMANTSILGLAIPLSPITLLFGAPVTFALISTLALAGTASAWYWVLSRDLVRSKAAAFVGGLFCGFGPAMISQSTGHPNIAGQFLIPFIIRAVLRMGEPEHRVRKGLVLAGLVVYQCFINEEVLFLTALALGIFLLVYLKPREILPTAKRALPALGVTALAAGLVMAYPLWHQFTGPQSYRGLPEFVLGFSADVASFTEYSRRSIIGDVERIKELGGATEENTFFGWPLLLLVPAAAVALWRHRVARGVAVTAATFAVFSLGPTLRYKGEDTSWTGPWKLLTGLPLFDSVVPTRLALVMTPLIGVLLALIVDRLVLQPAFAPARFVWVGALAVALLPLIPTPQPVEPRSAIPRFFTSGQWREALPPNATVVPVPGGWFEYLDAMRWSTAAELDFRIVGGYFLAPDPGRADGKASFGPATPPTMELLASVGNNGQVPWVTAAQQAQARADVAYWRATTLLLPDAHGGADAIRNTLDQLFGPGQHVEDVWLWDVRSLS
jgi:hypothetical protein